MNESDTVWKVCNFFLEGKLLLGYSDSEFNNVSEQAIRAIMDLSQHVVKDFYDFLHPQSTSDWKWSVIYSSLQFDTFVIAWR